MVVEVVGVRRASRTRDNGATGFAQARTGASNRGSSMAARVFSTMNAVGCLAERFRDAWRRFLFRGLASSAKK